MTKPRAWRGWLNHMLMPYLHQGFTERSPEHAPSIVWAVSHRATVCCRGLPCHARAGHEMQLGSAGERAPRLP